jgi:hypothetical protein
LESQLRVEPLAGLPGPGVTTNLVNNVVAAIVGLFGSGRPVPVDGNYVLLGFGTDGAALALGAVLQQVSAISHYVVYEFVSSLDS